MAVNLSPYGGVGTQFFDNSGNVLTGGKIFTYAAGTTTPQATYTSSTGGTPHPNPIILDAAGRVPGGEIWLTDGLSYKFILRDANDVLIATYDNVTGINSNFVAFTNQQEIQTATAGQTVFNLTTMSYQPATNSLSVFVDGVNQYGPGAQYAYLETDSDTVTFVNGLHVGAEVKFTTSQLNSSGLQANAFQVSYTPPFTGSAATNVGDKLAQTISVKDFGAVGDGVTDDSVAIGAAIAYASNPVNAVYCKGLFFPNGQYLVTQNNWIGANLTSGTYGGKIDNIFYGEGRNSSVIIFKPTVANAACYNQTLTPSQLLNGFSVQNLGFVFNNSANGSQPIHFIYSDAVAGQASQNFRLFETRFQGVTGSRLFWLAGNVNEDVISVYNTSVSTFENIVYSPTNLEAVLHSFYSLQCDNMLGSVFKYNCGGSLQVDTLDAIMNGTAGVDTAVLELTGGTTSRIYKLNNVRTELRGANTRLLLMPIASENTIIFSNSEVANVINNQAWAKVVVQHHAAIVFNECIFPIPNYSVTSALGTQGTLQLTDSTSGFDYSLVGEATSLIRFNNCATNGNRIINTDPWVDFTLLTPASANYRTIEVAYKGCVNFPDSVEYGFDYRQGASFVTSAPQKMIFRGTTFPTGDGVSAPVVLAGDLNTVIPLNNFVTEIVVMRTALTTAATNYQIQFIDTQERTNPGTGVIFGATTAAPNNAAISQRVPILRRFTGTRDQRTIWCRMSAGYTLGSSVGVPTNGGIYAEIL